MPISKGRAARTTFWHYILCIWSFRSCWTFWGSASSRRGGTCASGAHARDQCRRLHDVNKSGWLILVPTIPAFLTVSLFYLFWPLAWSSRSRRSPCSAYLIYLYVLRARRAQPIRPIPRVSPPPERRFVRQKTCREHRDPRAMLLVALAVIPIRWGPRFPRTGTLTKSSHKNRLIRLVFVAAKGLHERHRLQPA